MVNYELMKSLNILADSSYATTEFWGTFIFLTIGALIMVFGILLIGPKNKKK
jgi:L-asparagine transporter-like permease